MKPHPLLWVAALLLLLGGCGWFGGDDEDDDDPKEIKPTPLEDFTQEVALKVAWSRKLGKRAKDGVIKLTPALVGGRVFAATAGGHIAAMRASNGESIWEVHVEDFYTKEERTKIYSDKLDVITGGVGAGEDLVAVGTSSGEVIALNMSDGSLAWRIAASSEVLAPPQIGNGIVVVQTIDDKVASYDATTGNRNWLYTSTAPALSLRGTATPLLADNYVIAGFSNGRLVVLDVEEGIAGFDQRIAIAEGESDLERLVDIDGKMALTSNSNLYVASFQGQLVGIDMSGGKLLWAEEASSLAGVGRGFGNIYLSHADSKLTAYNAVSGREVWSVEALLHREITAPTVIRSYVAVSDYDGYVHLLAQSDGRFVARSKVDGTGLTAGLVASGSRIYAMGDSGKLTVIEIR